MDIQALVKKYFFVLWIAGAVVVAALVGFLFYLLLKDLSVAQANKDQHVQGLSFARNMVAVKKDSGKKVPLPAGHDVAAVVEAVKALAVKNNIRVILVQGGIKAKVSSALYEKKPIVIELRSSFKDLGLFLSNVRAMPQGMVDVEDMVIKAEQKDPNQVWAKITFLLFVAKTNG